MNYAEAKRICAEAFARAAKPGRSPDDVRQEVALAAAVDKTLMSALLIVASKGMDS